MTFKNIDKAQKYIEVIKHVKSRCIVTFFILYDHETYADNFDKWQIND